MSTTEKPESVQDSAVENTEIPLDKIPSPTLDRLIEEIRNEETNSPHAYNRIHHRHNR